MARWDTRPPDVAWHSLVNENAGKDARPLPRRPQSFSEERDKVRTLECEIKTLREKLESDRTRFKEILSAAEQKAAGLEDGLKAVSEELCSRTEEVFSLKNQLDDLTTENQSLNERPSRRRLRSVLNALLSEKLRARMAENRVHKHRNRKDELKRVVRHLSLKASTPRVMITWRKHRSIRTPTFEVVAADCGDGSLLTEQPENADQLSMTPPKPASEQQMSSPWAIFCQDCSAGFKSQRRAD